MFFSAEHHTNIQILKLIENAMEKAMCIQYGVSNGAIKQYCYQSMLNGVADTVARKIIRQKVILRCEPSIN